MRARALAVLGLILGGSAAAEPLDWFASSWCYDAGGTRFEERWTGEAGGVLIGMAETVAGHRITGFEFMRIERRGGTELYVGHAPRQLDRNITLAGRVLQGMDWGSPACLVVAKRRVSTPTARPRYQFAACAWPAMFRWPNAVRWKCCAPTGQPSKHGSNRDAIVGTSGTNFRRGISTCAMCPCRYAR